MFTEALDESFSGLEKDHQSLAVISVLTVIFNLWKTNGEDFKNLYADLSIQ